MQGVHAPAANEPPKRGAATKLNGVLGGRRKNTQDAQVNLKGKVFGRSDRESEEHREGRCKTRQFQTRNRGANKYQKAITQAKLVLAKNDAPLKRGVAKTTKKSPRRFDASPPEKGGRESEDPGGRTMTFSPSRH